jgi:hypothetical protein
VESKGKARNNTSHPTGLCSVPGVCFHPFYSISFEVKLPSACSFIVDGLAFCC